LTDHSSITNPTLAQKIAAIAVLLLILGLFRVWTSTQPAPQPAPARTEPVTRPTSEQTVDARPVSIFTATGGLVPDAQPTVPQASDVFAHTLASPPETAPSF
jgi:hypothetical protein